MNGQILLSGSHTEAQPGIAIIHGTVHTITRGTLEDHTVLTRGGVIEESTPSPSVPDGYQAIDARGRIVMPGMIDAHTHIGLCEEGVGWDSSDLSEAVEPAAPALRGLDAVNPGDMAFQEAVAAGITTVGVAPGSDAVIGGSCVAIKTHGRVLHEMLLREPCGLKIAFGRNPQFHFREQKKYPSTRMGVAGVLREKLAEARNYARKRERAHRDPEQFCETDLALEVLCRMLRREFPARVHVANAEDIATVLRIADEFGFDVVLDHATEGHLVPSLLAERHVPCVVGPMMVAGKSPQTRNLTFRTPAALAREGVPVALTTDHPVIPLKLLPLQAALAVKAGLDEKAALRAITIHPAEILGVANRVGSLEPGKDADVVILTGNPLDPFTNVVATLVNGRLVCTGKGAFAPLHT